MDRTFARPAHDDLARHHENFFAGHCEIFPCLNRCQCGTQTARSDDGDQHHVGIGQAGDLAQPLFTRKNLRLVLKPSVQEIGAVLINETDKRRPRFIRSRSELFSITISGQANDLHPLRDIARHFQCALADRARCTQDDHAFTSHFYKSSHKEHNGAQPAKKLFWAL